ncbi:hypothetical protein DN757_28890 [Paenibacillus silvae]|uniref:Uncharacterized protein n=2 Tax=Paenibacillus silvae TaxID=1325358 RepID=A0A2W6N8W3_9BACL|nr:hypothetical protein DN757_28890 [Paenibacillus silvae]
MSGVVIQTQKVRIVRLQFYKRQSLELRGTHVDCDSLRMWKREHSSMDGNQADEVEVFGLFGGDLPVMHQAVNRIAENGWVTIHTTRR